MRCALEIATLACTLLAPRSGGAQPSGGPATAGVGGLLGAYSGMMLGMVGSTIPCSQTFHSIRCIQVSSGTIALAAGLSGVLIGAADDARIGHVASNVGIGITAGTLAGAGLSRFTQRVGLRDVAALGLMGGAVAAVPRGTGIGLGIGTAVGLLLMGMADLQFPDAVAIAAIGLAAGGLAQWAVDAHDAQTPIPVPITSLLAYRVRF